MVLLAVSRRAKQAAACASGDGVGVAPPSAQAGGSVEMVGSSRRLSKLPKGGKAASPRPVCRKPNLGMYLEALLSPKAAIA